MKSRSSNETTRNGAGAAKRKEVEATIFVLSSQHTAIFVVVCCKVCGGTCQKTRGC